MMEEIAEKLLGRSLVDNDGINIETIEEIEYILEIKLPKCLKEFYLKVGNIKLFTESFEKFLYIYKLYFEKNMLVFLEENQNVCIWGINVSEEDPIVFQNANDEWYSVEKKLSEFLVIIMYYQCAQGYENAESIELDRTKIEEIILRMEKVVDNNHLMIYYKNNILLWYYTDLENKIVNNSIIISGITKEKLIEFKNMNNI